MPEPPHLHLQAAVNAAVQSQTAIRQAAQDAAEEDAERDRQSSLAFPAGSATDSDG